MVVEQLIFTLISFAIFVYMFFRMIKNNDSSYVIILVLEAIGIALNFAEVLFGIKLNILFKIVVKLFESNISSILSYISSKSSYYLVSIYY